MLKNLFFISLIFISISCKSNKSSRTSFGLHGNVKTMVERYYAPVEKFGEWTKDYEIEGLYIEYDKEGSAISITNYSTDDIIRSKSIPILKENLVIGYNIYNSSGDRIEVDKLLWKSDSLLETKTYEENGRLKRTILGYHDKQGRVYKSEWRLHDFVEEIGIDSIDSVANEEDNFGLNPVPEKPQIKPLSRDWKGKTEFFFTDSGYIIKTTNFDSEPKESEFVFKYLELDSHKNWTKGLVYESKNSEKPVGIYYRTLTYW